MCECNQDSGGIPFICKEHQTGQVEGSAGSMPRIGQTVVCKTSRNEHRMRISTMEQVNMIADLLVENPKGWAIEATI